jgi:hypothetical protein
VASLCAGSRSNEQHDTGRKESERTAAFNYVLFTGNPNQKEPGFQEFSEIYLASFPLYFSAKQAVGYPMPPPIR